MKKCPQCNRTYADEGFTFCLEDGTLLSPPYDPKSEEPISTIVSSEPPPTVALPPKQDQETAATRQDERGPAPLPPTIASPIPQEPAVLRQRDLSVQGPKQSKLPYVIGSFMLLVAVLGIVFFFWFRRTQCVNV